MVDFVVRRRTRSQQRRCGHLTLWFAASRRPSGGLMQVLDILARMRRLMLIENLDAAVAAQQVGYESATHFEHDYRRLFGRPPRQDVTRLRTPESGQGEGPLHQGENQ
jgi:AraC-like DNA-binding protein